MRLTSGANGTFVARPDSLTAIVTRRVASAGCPLVFYNLPFLHLASPTNLAMALRFILESKAVRALRGPDRQRGMGEP